MKAFVSTIDIRPQSPRITHLFVTDKAPKATDHKGASPDKER